MNPIVILLSSIISLIWWAIFIWFVLSLLIQFDVINRWHPLVSRVYQFLENLINPMLRPIRRFIPTIGGVDLSPLVLILGLQFLKNSLIYYAQ